jgi:hypothetical protein
MVAPAGCPWRGVLDRLPGVIEVKRNVQRARLVFAPLEIVPPAEPNGAGLQQWATVMTSAACHRSRLSPSDVAALTAPFLDLLPELPAFINGWTPDRPNRTPDRSHLPRSPAPFGAAA